MGVLLAQEFELVRGEVDHQQPPARPQQARRFPNGAPAILQEVQHLMDDHHVEGVAAERKIVDVALPDAAMLEACALKIGAGDAEHFGIEVDPDAAADLGAEQFEHAAGAGAEVEEALDAHARKRFADRRFDRGLGDVELAQFVPVTGVLAEISLRRGGARGPHLVQPLAVAGKHPVGRVDEIEERLPEFRARPLGYAAMKGPASFAEALDQAGLRQEPQMSRYARLRLAENFDEVGDRQFRLTQQHQETQARVLRRGLEAREQRFKSEPIVLRRQPHLPTEIPAYLAADRVHDHFAYHIRAHSSYYDTFSDSTASADSPQKNLN